MRTDRIGRAATAAAMIVVAVTAAGCEKKAPKGQVVATVNGQDITRRDVMAELQAARVPANVDVKAVQPLATQQIVDRSLLVAEAKKEGLDKTPDYLAMQRRATDQLLAEQLVAKWAKQLREPSDADVRAYIADNPHMFGERKVLAVDQVRASQAGLDLKQFEPAKTMDQVIAILNAQHQRFDRGRSTIDTVRLTKAAAKQIADLPPGMPFINGDGSNVIFSVVSGSSDQPLPDAAQPNVAKAAMREIAMRKTVGDQIKSLKTGAKIEYQPGFAPPKPRG